LAGTEKAILIFLVDKGPEDRKFRTYVMTPETTTMLKNGFGLIWVA
jgi:hypothetical protein